MADEQNGYEIISRKEAQERGLKTFFTGLPCKKGHLDLKIVATQNCRECGRLRSLAWKHRNREALNKKDRDWRRDNPDDAAEFDKREYARRREHQKARVRRYYRNNREKVIRYAREYFWANRDILNEKARARTIRWARNNPEKARAAVKNYKVRKRGNGGTHTGDDRKEIFKMQKGKCAFCRVSLKKVTKHLDHIIPLVRGGRNDRANLQFLCEPCNLRKGARDQIDIMRSMGRLL